MTTIGYEYDAAGQKQFLVDPEGGRTEYGYDDNGELTSLAAPGLGLFTYDRDRAGRVTALDRPNGVTTGRSYDDSGRLLTLRHEGPGGVLEETGYGYNEVGLVETMTRGGYPTSYGYDATDQLTAADQTHPLLPDESYSYDGVGNRLSSHLSADYDYDDASQLLEDDQWEYAYDANGRQVEKVEKATGDRWTYGYDAEDRLVTVRRYAGGSGPLELEVSYTYDGLGRRIGRTVDGERTSWVYDGQNFLRTYDGLGQVISTHVNGPGIDEPLAVQRGGSWRFHLADRLGSITGWTDGSGQATGEMLYDSFGRILQGPADPPDGYAFTGREWEKETGEYYYRTRQMDPASGQFRSVDSQERGVAEFGTPRSYSHEYVSTSVRIL